jgi:hypothetical protein
VIRCSHTANTTNQSEDEKSCRTSKHFLGKIGRKKEREWRIRTKGEVRVVQEQPRLPSTVLEAMRRLVQQQQHAPKVSEEKA